MKMMSVDIEIADIFEVPEGGDLDQFAPFHISVAAIAVPGGEEKLWFSRNPDGTIADHLNQTDALDLLHFLRDAQEDHRLFAWNGLSFDLKWIGYAAGDIELARDVALQMYDPMFQFFMARGFPVALAKVAEAMGIKQEKLMNGADAPGEWLAGNHSQVMDYVIGDCQITNAVVQAIQTEGCIRWRTQRGKLSAEPMPVLLPVSHLFGGKLPDQNWMDAPIPVEKFTGWLTNWQY